MLCYSLVCYHLVMRGIDAARGKLSEVILRDVFLCTVFVCFWLICLSKTVLIVWNVDSGDSGDGDDSGDSGVLDAVASLRGGTMRGRFGKIVNTWKKTLNIYKTNSQISSSGSIGKASSLTEHTSIGDMQNEFSKPIRIWQRKPSSHQRHSRFW